MAGCKVALFLLSIESICNGMTVVVINYYTLRMKINCVILQGHF